MYRLIMIITDGKTIKFYMSNENIENIENIEKNELKMSVFLMFFEQNLTKF